MATVIHVGIFDFEVLIVDAANFDFLLIPFFIDNEPRQKTLLV